MRWSFAPVVTALLALLALVACRDTPSSGATGVRSLDALLGAPLQASAEGTTLTLAVDAWRSFQPLVGDAGDPLIAALHLRVPDGGAGVPGALVARNVWLVRGSEVVSAQAQEESPREAGATSMELMVRDGPRWAAGDSIDVIVELGGVGASPMLLRAPRVAIARVD